jgi:hypothetical protein
MYRCPESLGVIEGKEGRYSGFYQAEFENSSFKMSHEPCEVWLTGNLCQTFGERGCAKGAEVKAYITVEGVLSPPGHFGHFGMWERELHVTRVIKTEQCSMSSPRHR